MWTDPVSFSLVLFDIYDIVAHKFFDTLSKTSWGCISFSTTLFVKTIELVVAKVNMLIVIVHSVNDVHVKISGFGR